MFLSSNGKYDDQIDKLKTLSKQKASRYITENANNIKEDIEYVNGKEQSIIKLGLGDDSFQILKEYIGKYKHLNIAGDSKSGMGFVSANGTREEVYDDLVGLFSDLHNAYGKDHEVVNEIKEWISDTTNDALDIDEIKQSKANIKKYAEAQILSGDDTAKVYDDATKIQKKNHIKTALAYYI